MNIEKQIPMPEPSTAFGQSRKYPFNEMEIGDSVLAEGFSSTKGCHPYNAAKVYGGRSGKKFSARKVEGGVRIWRIE